MNLNFAHFLKTILIFNLNFLHLTNGTTHSNLLEIDLKLSSCQEIELREITLPHLQNLLQNGRLTSVDLVKCYNQRIQEINPFLNAVIQLNPAAENVAEFLDEERKLGRIRGPLHGIPILIKDNFDTGDKMETTAGSTAFIGIRAKVDAEVVKLLKRAGAIILGKTNLSEFATFRGTNVPAGWSSRGGQTHNAYVLSQTPEGSSSGSAVAVAANLIPVAIGTETFGSIVRPAALASCVGLKTTLGRISTEGVIPLAPSQDTVGIIARTVKDAGIVFGAISKNGLISNCFNVQTGFANCQIHGYRIGVLRNPYWITETVRPDIPALQQVLHVLKHAGAQIIDPVQGSTTILNQITLANTFIIKRHEFKNGINTYLTSAVRGNINSKGYRIDDIQDIVNFNAHFPSPTGYNQQYLIEASQVDGIFNQTYLAARRDNQEGSKRYLESIFQNYRLDAIVVPTNGSELVPASAGFPHVTVPAGFRVDNVPFGVSLFGLPNTEEVLLTLAHWIEKRFPARRTSSFLP